MGYDLPPFYAPEGTVERDLRVNGDLRLAAPPIDGSMSDQSTRALSASGVTQTCTFQAKDGDGNNIAAVQRVRVYLATTAAGVTLAAAANGTVAPTTGTVLKAHTAKLDWDLLTDDTGKIVLSIGNTGGTDHYAVYVIFVLPNGKLIASAVTDVRSA